MEYNSLSHNVYCLFQYSKKSPVTKDKLERRLHLPIYILPPQYSNRFATLSDIDQYLQIITSKIYYNSFRMASSSSNSTAPSMPVSTPTLSRSKAKVAARHAESRALNPGFDRKPAKVNQVDHTKLSITVKHLAPSSPTQLDYPYDVDWSDQKSVTYLNSWRGRKVRYWYGRASAKKRKSTIFFCNEEKAWLFREARDRSVKWTNVVKRFNQEFEGNLLKGCDVRRPARTSEQLRALHARLLRIERDALGTENEEDYDDDDVAESGSESELEEGEIREYPQTGKLVRPWEL